MHGTTKGDEITNDDYVGSASKAFTIDGGAGNDSISNSKDYVSIVGGAGNDVVTVGGSAKTTGVTVKGGAGNDSIYFTGADTVGGHVIQFDVAADGKDVIFGIGSDDTVTLTSNGSTFNFDAANLKVDQYGNVILSINSSHQITLKDGVTLLGGEELTINGNPVKIPKKWVGTTGANTLYADTKYDGYSLSADAGADSITISGSAIYADAGTGNDRIVLTRTTAAADAVTINGSDGNDYIDATGDTVNGHIYQFDNADGKDSILGFNESDTILITNTSGDVTGVFENGNFVIKNGDYTQIVLEDYKGGGKINFLLKTAEGYETIYSSRIGDGFTAYTTSGGKEGTVDLTTYTGSDAYYRIKKGSQGDNKSNEITIGHTDNDFVIDAREGNDKITVQGADNVSISAGVGNDSIYVIKYTESSQDTYSANMTINGGTGNDLIVVETVASGSPNPTGADPKAYPKIYEFTPGDGTDSIIGFGEYDTIKILGDGTVTAVSVDANNKDAVVIYKDNSNASGKIILKDYASKLYEFAGDVNIIDDVIDAEGSRSKTKELPKILKGTTGSDSINTGNVSIFGGKSISEGYKVSLGSGNDTVTNAVSSVTLNGDGGDDYISTGGKDVSINGGAGKDKITLQSGAENAYIVAGTGNDSIYGNTNGGHTYEFASGQGTNYIVNFNPANDTIYSSEEITAVEPTADGYKLTIGTTIIYLRGALAPGASAGSENVKDYQLLEGSAIIKTRSSGTDSDVSVARIIKGTTGKDTIENIINGSHLDVDGYTINADNGNDVIYNSGSNVSINAGAGNDTIFLMTDETNSVNSKASTVYAGAGNDLIIGNGEGHVYQYSGGKDSIYGFSAQDTLEFGEAYKQSVTNDGLLIVSQTDTSKYVLLKGEAADPSENSTSAGDYASLEAGTKINIKGSGATVVTDYVEAKYLGTNASETVAIDISSKELAGNYTIDAMGGDDTITSNGDKVYVSAGVGNDQITIEDGTQVTVNPGKGEDTIRITDKKETGHVFEIAKGDGVNIISGINSNDTIKITTANASILTAKFDSDASLADLETQDNYFVITLDDKKTKIKLLGAEKGTSGHYETLKNKSFYISLTLTDGRNETVETYNYNVPNVLRVDSATSIDPTTIQTLDSDVSTFEIYGDKYNNTISNNGADNVLISLGAGNDSITITSGENNTINPGAGKDYVTLTTSGHIYEYYNNDGDDTIVGWTSDDTLMVYGATSIASLISSINNGNGVGKDFQLKIGNNKITFVNTDPDTVINLENKNTAAMIGTLGTALGTTANDIASGTTVAISIPKLIQGTSGANELTNDRDEYTISADKGNDSINTSGNKVSVDAGVGNDVITIASGENITVTAGNNNDTVYVNYGSNNAYIDGGDGKDVIVIGDNVTGVSVEGGVGDDLIIGNNAENVYYYNNGDGKDSIYGFTEDDKIVLGAGLTIYSVSGNDDNNVKAEVTDNGLVFSIYQTVASGSYTEVGKLTLKGERNNGSAEGSTVASAYGVVTGGINFNINGSDVTYKIPNRKVVTAANNNVLANSDSNYLITGTSNADTITNTANSVTIDAREGNDTIKTSGNNTSINAGVGNDTVEIDASAENVTVASGAGNDLIISNGKGGNVYRYTGGKDTIYGFSTDDTLIIDPNNTTSYTPEVTADGLLIKVKNSASNSILLKGAGTVAGSTNASDYALLDGGNSFHVLINTVTSSAEQAQYVDCETTISKLLVGTGTGEELNASIEGYTVQAYGGDDTITSNVDGALIDAGAGNDIVTISAGENVTVISGKGSDLITITDESGAGHLFQFKPNEGTTTIKGFGSNDSIHFTDSNSIKSAEFATVGAEGEYFVLNLDNNTKVYLQAQDDKAPNPTKLRKDSFYIKYANDTVFSEYNIPNTYTIGGSDHKDIAVTGPDFEKAAIIGVDSLNNDITVGAAAEVSVYAAKGNDTIRVTSQAQSAIINAGVGNDYITLEGTGHVIQYANGDGHDTIEGWNEDNILSITSGAAATSTSVNSAGDYVLKIGSGSITFKGLAADTNIKVYKDGTEVSGGLSVPKELIGTSGNDTLRNTIEGYFIDAKSGNDAIISGINEAGTDAPADNVTIDAGAGHDTIAVAGNNVSIEAGAGKDTVDIISGTNVTINTGADVDFITLRSGVVNAVINAGAANDTIYTNEEGNIIKYNLGDGNDSIFGYTSADSIKLGTGVRVVDYAMTDKGFIVTVTGGVLTFKGGAYDAATGTYKDLDGGTIINIYENGTDNAADVVTPFIKYVDSKDHTIDNSATNYTVRGSKTTDTIENTADNVTIMAGDKADVIISKAGDVYIAGEAGADTIDLRASASNNTIYGGAGNDSIYGNDNGHIYKFNAYTDGKDVIDNFTENDVIYLGNFQDYWGKNKEGKWESDNITDLISLTFNNVENKPSYKDVVVKFKSSSNSITLKELEVGTKIRYSYDYVATVGGVAQTRTAYINDYWSVDRVYEMDARPVNNTLESNTIVSKNETQADTIINSAAYVIIDSRGSDDTIHNALTGIETSIKAGAGNDTITNEADRVTINAGDGADIIANGADTIANSASAVLIFGGDGEDTINLISGENVSVEGGAGNDFITVTSDKVVTPLIKAGAGDDIIGLTISGASIEGGEGNDIIKSESGGNTYIYTAGDGNDIIKWHEGDELKLILKNNETYTTESAVNGYLVKVTTANGTTNTIALTDSIIETPVTLGSGADTVVSTSYSSGSLPGGVMIDIKYSNNGEIFTPSTLSGYSPNNIFVATGANTITGGIATVDNTITAYEVVNIGTDAKVIKNSGTYVTINAGSGDDTIANDADNVIINGGAGKDFIILGTYDELNGTVDVANHNDVSINAGAGNDVITLGGSQTVTYMYKLGDGNDTIYGYDAANDRIYIEGFSEGDYQYSIDNDNTFIVNVSSGTTVGSIRLDGIRGEGIKVDGSTNSVTFVDADGAETEIIIPQRVTITGGAVTDLDNTKSYGFAAPTVASSAAASLKNDTVNVTDATNIEINTGEGDDSIKLSNNLENVSIIAGRGNDTIEAKSGHSEGIMYVFGNGDGNNLIINASTDDSIKFTDGTFTPNLSNCTTERDTLNNEILVLTLGSTKVSMRGFYGGDTFTLIDRDNNSQLITVPRLFKGTGASETLSNEEDDYQILAMGGNDLIKNTGHRAILTADSGNNTIRNEGTDVTINGGNGSDLITNEGGDNVSISGGNGNDSINLNTGSTGLTVYGGGGDDIIASNNVNGVIYQVSNGSGRDSIRGFDATKDKIQIIDDSALTPLGPTSFDTSNKALTLRIGGATVVLQGTGVEPNGEITLLKKDGTTETATVLQVQSVESGAVTPVEGNKFYVFGTNGKDTINNTEHDYTKVSIMAGGDADSITNEGTYASIFGEAGADTIINSGRYSSIYGGNDNDTIHNTGADVYIAGDAGNDTITNTANDVTIWGGGGNDYLDATSRTSGAKVIYEFRSGDGTDTIANFVKDTDELWFSGITSADALPAAVSINAGSNQFSITAYNNTNIIGFASGDLTSNSEITAYFGANHQAGTIKIARLLVGNEYSSTLNPATSGNTYQNSSNVALLVQGGKNVENSSTSTDGASIRATDGSNWFHNLADITAAAADAEQKYTYLTLANNADTIINKGAYAIIDAGGGNDTISNNKANVTITAGAGDDTINSTGTGTDGGISINAGDGNDFITITGGQNTVVAGTGNDYITAKDPDAEEGNVYYFAGLSGEGTNTIVGLTDKDTIMVNANSTKVSTNIYKSGEGGKDVTIFLQRNAYNSTTIVLQGYNEDANNKFNLKLLDTAAEDVEKTVPGDASPRIAEDPVMALDDLFADDNYMTNDAQISDITAITQDNYSAGNVETFDLENLTKSSYTPTATYGKDEQK